MNSHSSLFAVDHCRPLVMGVVNITPDSFSDGGKLYASGRPDVDSIVSWAAKLIDQGADILDIGGQSTRPGARPVTESEEIERVIPALAALARRFDVPLSVDTSVPAVMKLAAQEGAAMINDVYALRFPGAIQAAAETKLPVVLMHMQGEPRTMQAAPQYDDVASEVGDFLAGRVLACEAAGIDRNRLAIDPGFGFGKTLEHNMSLFRALPGFAAMGLPVLVGLSRKRMIGELLDKPVADRVYGSIAIAMLAAQRGVSMIRVHDVAGTVDALKVLAAIESYN